jgi:hypothetical protein
LQENKLKVHEDTIRELVDNQRYLESEQQKMMENASQMAANISNIDVEAIANMASINTR